MRIEKDVCHQDERKSRLRKVFIAFDHDDNLMLSDDEIQSMTRAQSHAIGVDWSAERSKRVVAEMDRNENGLIEENEFVEHFEKALPKGFEMFVSAVDQFMESAAIVLNEKVIQYICIYIYTYTTTSDMVHACAGSTCTHARIGSHC